MKDGFKQKFVLFLWKQFRSGVAVLERPEIKHFMYIGFLTMLVSLSREASERGIL